MDYSLESYLDEDDNNRINSITNKLDNLMDELFFGKELGFFDVLHDIKYLENVKVEYLELIDKHRNILSEDATLTSKAAGRSFIISISSILSAYFIPFMAVPSIIAFARGMKYYTVYNVLRNKEVVDEYLSTFDNLQNRINNYNELFRDKYMKMIENNKDYLLLMNIFAGQLIKVDDELEKKLTNLLNKELNTSSSNIGELISLGIKRINNEENIEKDENNTLLLKK